MTTPRTSFGCAISELAFHGACWRALRPNPATDHVAIATVLPPLFGAMAAEPLRALQRVAPLRHCQLLMDVFVAPFAPQGWSPRPGCLRPEKSAPAAPSCCAGSVGSMAALELRPCLPT